MIDDLRAFVKLELSGRPIRAQVDQMVREGTSSAGKRHEEVFTREFLCPAMARFFYIHTRAAIGLSDAQVRSGLGTEGFENCTGFGFTPARQDKHLFAKSDFIMSAAPASWYSASTKTLPPFQACPDFAIRDPLPISVVGETK